MSITRTPAANATAVVVRAGITEVKRIRVKQFNSAAPRLFLQLFNTNAPTVGTTAPELVLRIPAGDSKKDSARAQYQINGNDMNFATGLSYAVTTTHDGNTAPTAGHEPEVIVDWEPLT